VRKLEVLRISGGEREARSDLVAEEISLQLLAGHRRIAVLMCSPADLEDLIRGFFFTNGFIRTADQIRKIVVNRRTGSVFIELAPEIDPDGFQLSGVIGSACGAALPVGEQRRDEWWEEQNEGPGREGRIEPGGQVRESGGKLRVEPQQISALMEELGSRSQLHRQTGGVHSAALADPAGILVFREDIGRHNAVDKAIGAYLLQDGNFNDKLLLTSGRLSSEILHKAAAAGFPVVVSRSAATDRCVAAARERNITLIGFARGVRMNVYSGEHRIGGSCLTSPEVPQYTRAQEKGKG
jgi:FdhD protein